MADSSTCRGLLVRALPGEHPRPPQEPVHARVALAEPLVEQRPGQVEACRTDGRLRQGLLKHVALRVRAAEVLEHGADGQQLVDDVVVSPVRIGEHGARRRQAHLGERDDSTYGDEAERLATVRAWALGHLGEEEFVTRAKAGRARNVPAAAAWALDVLQRLGG